MSGYKKRNCEPRPCSVCGKVFTPPHGNRKICNECREKLKKNIGSDWVIQYENPVDVAGYEYRLSRRNKAKFSDTIVAIGYADRQREKTLAMVGKIKVTL